MNLFFVDECKTPSVNAPKVDTFKFLKGFEFDIQFNFSVVWTGPRDRYDLIIPIFFKGVIIYEKNYFS